MIVDGQITNYLDYKGAYIGKLNSYAHQIYGELYAIDERTILIKDFFYDGLASDAYFWVGATILPSNVGFIVPDETGRTNKLRQYINRSIRIRLPDDKTIHTIRWFAIWDIRSQKNFADLFIPEGFLPPTPQTIAEFSQLSNGIKSEPIVIVDAKTIRIPSFTYDGHRKQAYFWVGQGPQPNSAGERIPNELGYLEPLGPYRDDLVILELPGNMTIFDINYISVWDQELSENLGSVIIPAELNIPPALTTVIKVESRLPNCEQLHQRLQVNWEVFGPQITIELIGQLKKDDYMAFGISGSDNSSRMIGSDIAIAYMETHLGFTRDYNITGAFPCTNVLGHYQGVCPDEKVGGVDNYQVNLFERQDSLTRITYRRNLQNVGDEGDRTLDKSKATFIVWAIGKLTQTTIKHPGFHHIYPKHDKSIVFGRKSERNCFHFTTPRSDLFEQQQQLSNTPISTQTSSLITKPWGPLRLLNRTMTTFYARLGDSGGLRGYYGSTGQASPNLVWYMNGMLAPILYVKRGRTYTFRVEGGNNPQQAELYNPLYITNDPHGGYTELTETERKRFNVYAGVEFDRRGRPSPTSAGRLCVWRIPSLNETSDENDNNFYFDKRRADTNRFANFIQYRNRLQFYCDSSTSAQILQWTPNASVPDIVYYQSYTHRNMGNRIIVVDDFYSSNNNFVSASTIMTSSTVSLILNNNIIILLLLINYYCM
uniref:Protein Skeletor, isoforms B/C-like n=1 Tax=Dermatophagoides pteronyssinus TaxID=6956 RepID=A0A6P6YJD8_DERPT|nr:protein Skeletor, isoforms B/C-like [Dermatophagoides pteronyssinus]